MNLRVHLAGHWAWWRFQQSGRLDEWLSSEPWRREGDVVVLRIPGRKLFERIAEALGRAARSSDTHGDVEVRVLPAIGDTRSLEQRLRFLLDLSDAATSRDFCEHLARFMTRPTIFVAFVDGPSSAGLADDEARRLRDRLAFVREGSAATFVLMDVAEAPLTGDVIRLTIGRPLDSALHLEDSTEERSWRAYVHTRLAWEVAGDVGTAFDWNESGFSDLTPGDDDCLERLLNERAKSMFDSLDSSLAEQLSDALGQPRPNLANAPWNERFCWNPSGEDWRRPAPWLARALLLRCRNHCGRSLLRSCLVCSPLAREILDRCMVLEARERARSGSQTQSPDADSQSRKNWDEFQRNARVESSLYPKCCPARPQEPVELAAFGEFIQLTKPPNRSEYDPRYDLLHLRNAIAHGHYVNWQALRLLWQIEEKLHR